MKFLALFSLLGYLLGAMAQAQFETWTNKEGKAATLKLLEVVSDGEKISGKFEMKNRSVIKIDSGSLSEADAVRLREWKPGPYQILEGNLVSLSGTQFAAYQQGEKPPKHYVFYHTASWCGPCRAYTPELIRFHERSKAAGADFELVMFSHDKTKSAMLSYAKDDKMPWPMVAFDKTSDVSVKLRHNVNSVPTVIVLDAKGKVISLDRSIPNLEKILVN